MVDDQVFVHIPLVEEEGELLVQFPAQRVVSASLMELHRRTKLSTTQTDGITIHTANIPLIIGGCLEMGQFKIRLEMDLLVKKSD